MLARFRELTGVTPREGYGLTETAPLGTMQVTGAAPRPGTVGLPAPHTLIEVVDIESGTQVLPVGAKGEICVTGPQVMKGYWKKPEATAEAFRGGRFHTGDIGFIDADGFVTLVDRKKDMILSGGFNVFPRNIEEAIYEHPAVAEVTVIGIPDSYRGQAAKAFIVLKPGQHAFSFEELKIFLADKLAKYEMPSHHGNSREPAADAGRQAVEERAGGRGIGQARGGGRPPPPARSGEAKNTLSFSRRPFAPESCRRPSKQIKAGRDLRQMAPVVGPAPSRSRAENL